MNATYLYILVWTNPKGIDWNAQIYRFYIICKVNFILVLFTYYLQL